MKHRVYLSAPITGHDPEGRRELFAGWQRMFHDLGIETVNPMENGLPFDAPREEHIRTDLRHLLDCTAIVFITDECPSPGVLLERQVAEATGIKCVWAETVIIAKGRPETLDHLLTP